MSYAFMIFFQIYLVSRCYLVYIYFDAGLKMAFLPIHPSTHPLLQVTILFMSPMGSDRTSSVPSSVLHLKVVFGLEYWSYSIVYYQFNECVDNS